MTIREITEQLSLTVLCCEEKLDQEIEGGYASDMLSCVMAGAQKGNVWVTLLTHSNVIAVAVLLEIPVIIVTEHAPVEPSVLEKAAREGIVLLHSDDATFTMVGQLYTLGIR